MEGKVFVGDKRWSRRLRQLIDRSRAGGAADADVRAALRATAETCKSERALRE
jgi:hypothetical protein